MSALTGVDPLTAIVPLRVYAAPGLFWAVLAAVCASASDHALGAAMIAFGLYGLLVLGWRSLESRAQERVRTAVADWAERDVWSAAIMPASESAPEGRSDRAPCLIEPPAVFSVATPSVALIGACLAYGLSFRSEHAALYLWGCTAMILILQWGWSWRRSASDAAAARIMTHLQRRLDAVGCPPTAWRSVPRWLIGRAREFPFAVRVYGDGPRLGVALCVPPVASTDGLSWVFSALEDRREWSFTVADESRGGPLVGAPVPAGPVKARLLRLMRASDAIALSRVVSGAGLERPAPMLRVCSDRWLLSMTLPPAAKPQDVLTVFDELIAVARSNDVHRGLLAWRDDVRAWRQ